jgi:hypothetical protein
MHNGHRRGSSHPRWNAGRIVSDQGYVKLRVGTGHPLADPNGYAYEHILVMVAALGRQLADDELVHHRNEDKADNRFENLELLTRGEHAALHNALRSRDVRGRFQPEAGP